MLRWVALVNVDAVHKMHDITLLTWHDLNKIALLKLVWRCMIPYQISLILLILQVLEINLNAVLFHTMNYLLQEICPIFVLVCPKGILHAWAKCFHMSAVWGGIMHLCVPGVARRALTQVFPTSPKKTTAWRLCNEMVIICHIKPCGSECQPNAHLSIWMISKETSRRPADVGYELFICFLYT